MIRLTAMSLALALAAHDLVPLALACCDRPSAHSCCARTEDASDRLSTAPCCKASAGPQAIHKEAAMASVELPAARPVSVVMAIALAAAPRVGVPRHTRPPGHPGGSGPPLPLRI